MRTRIRRRGERQAHHRCSLAFPFPQPSPLPGSRVTRRRYEVASACAHAHQVRFIRRMWAKWNKDCCTHRTKLGHLNKAEIHSNAEMLPGLQSVVIALAPHAYILYDNLSLICNHLHNSSGFFLNTQYFPPVI